MPAENCWCTHVMHAFKYQLLLVNQRHSTSFASYCYIAFCLCLMLRNFMPCWPWPCDCLIVFVRNRLPHLLSKVASCPWETSGKKAQHVPLSATWSVFWKRQRRRWMVFLWGWATSPWGWVLGQVCWPGATSCLRGCSCGSYSCFVSPEVQCGGGRGDYHLDRLYISAFCLCHFKHSINATSTYFMLHYQNDLKIVQMFCGN